jgi:hypothetical protein
MNFIIFLREKFEKIIVLNKTKKVFFLDIGRLFTHYIAQRTKRSNETKFVKLKKKLKTKKKQRTSYPTKCVRKM